MTNPDAGSSSTRPSPGLSRLPIVSSIVNRILTRSTLNLQSLSAHSPSKDGLVLDTTLKISGTGPLKAKIKFPQGAQLYLNKRDVRLAGLETGGKGGERENGSRNVNGNGNGATYGRAKQGGDDELVLVGHAAIKPAKLKPSARGGSVLKLEISLKDSTSDSPSILALLIRSVLLKSSSSTLSLILKSDCAEVKAYGFRFGALKLEKQVLVQGLGRLSGNLQFPGQEEWLDQEETAQAKKLGNKSRKKSDVKSKSASTSDQPPPIQVEDLKLLSGHPTSGIQISAKVRLGNDSQISVEAGELRFEIKVKLLPSTSPASQDQDEVAIGNLLLLKTTLNPGSNLIEATGNLLLPPAPPTSSNPNSFETRAHKAGLSLITSLLENKPSNLIAKAYTSDSKNASSPHPWLAKALESGSIMVVLPPQGERSRILDGAEVKLGDGLKDGLQSQMNSPLSSKGSFLNGEAIARATLRNGFGIDIRLHALTARAVAVSNTQVGGAEEEELELGLIQTSKNWEGLVLKGNIENPLNSEGIPASLPFKFNPDPAVLVEMLRRTAGERGVGLGERLEEVLGMLPSSSRPSSVRNSLAVNRKDKDKPRSSTNERPSEDDPSMDLPLLITRALSSLRITAYVKAKASIGNYELPGSIEFIQESLPIVISGQTATHLIPHVGAPLVNALIEQGNVNIEGIKILKIEEKEIGATAKVSVDGFGPLLADVKFEKGLEIWLKAKGKEEFKLVGIFKVFGAVKAIPGNKDLQELPITLSPSSRPQGLELFATLVSSLLLEDSISLSLRSDQCNILAGGVEFVAPISKNVTFNSIGGFKNLKVSGFEVLGEGRAPRLGESLSSAMNAPVDSKQASALKVQLSVPLYNPGDLELELSRLELGIEFNGCRIGIIGADNVQLVPNSTCSVTAKGLILLPSQEDIGSDSTKIEKTRESIGMLVSGLLAGDALEVTVRGERAWVKNSSSVSGLSRKASHLQETSADSNYSVYSTSGPGTPPISSSVNGPGTPTSPSQENTSFSIAQNDKSRSSRARSTSANVRIPWLDLALRNFTTKAILKQDALGVIDRIDVGSLDVALTTQRQGGETTPSPKVQVNDLIASYGIPYPISVKVTHCAVDIDLMFDGEKVGKAQTEEEDVEVLTSNVLSNNDSGSRITGGALKLSLRHFNLTPSSDEVLARMIAHVAECEETSRISVLGKATVKAMTALGELKLQVSLAPSSGKEGDVGCRISMQGIRSMSTSPIQYDSLQVVDADSKRLKIKFNLYLNNPSKSVRLRLIDSSLSFGAYFSGHYVGRAIFGKGSFDLNSGPCKFENVEFDYEPEHEKGVRQLPSNLLTGKVTTLEIRGDDKSTPITSLRPALRGIKLSFDLQPMLQSTLIDSISVTLGISVLVSSVDADCVLNNPLGVPIHLKGLSFIANYRGKPFGTASILFPDDQPFKIRPGTPKIPGRDTAPPITVKLAQTLDKVVKAFLKEKGTIYLDVQAEANIELASSSDPSQPGFRMPVISYSQRIPLHINGLGGVSKLLWALPG